MVSMDLDDGNQAAINVGASGGGTYLQKFRLYETRSNFYIIGRDKNRTFWKVLKISRLEQSDLSIIEDPTTYSESECYELLKRIHEGNASTGGLKFVTTCYGIIGFIKFLGPYYMLLITKRRKIGTICGHAIYSIAKSEMIPLSNSTVKSNMTYSKDENRSLTIEHVNVNIHVITSGLGIRFNMLVMFTNLGYFSYYIPVLCADLNSYIYVASISNSTLAEPI